jgi:hypothetical protein
MLARAKAVCPDGTAGVHNVRAVSDCGRGPDGRDFYIYGCTCGRVWKQLRASQLRDGEVPHILPASSKSAADKHGQSYLCGRCHQPKKNHVCCAKRPRSPQKVIAQPFEVPVWFMRLGDKHRGDILAFVWRIDSSNVE